jgi:AcrR family transcriptional regulator
VGGSSLADRSKAVGQLSRERRRVDGGCVVTSGLSRADARRSRRLLLEAGTSAFIEIGLDVQVSEIARRAGLAKGTFFRHFPTKRSLLIAILARSLDEMAEIAERHADELTTPIIRRWAEAAAEKIIPIRAVIENATLSGVFDDSIRQAMGRLQPRLEVLRAAAVERGEIRDDVNAMDIFVTLMSATASVYAPRAAIQPDRWRRYLVLGLDGLRPEAASSPLPPG